MDVICKTDDVRTELERSRSYCLRQELAMREMKRIVLKKLLREIRDKKPANTPSAGQRDEDADGNGNDRQAIP